MHLPIVTASKRRRTGSGGGPTPAASNMRLQFGEGAGTALADSSGSGNNGVLNGAAPWSGGGVQFDGTTTQGTVATLNLGGAPSLTMFAVVDFSASAANTGQVDKTHTLLGRTYLAKFKLRTFGAEPGAGYFLALSVWPVGQGAGDTTLTVPFASKILGVHSLAATFDGTTITLYLDGAAFGSTQAVATPGPIGTLRGAGVGVGVDAEGPQDFSDFNHKWGEIALSLLSPAQMHAYAKSELAKRGVVLP